jgi:hypothetical protein
VLGEELLEGRRHLGLEHSGCFIAGAPGPAGAIVRSGIKAGRSAGIGTDS